MCVYTNLTIKAWESSDADVRKDEHLSSRALIVIKFSTTIRTWQWKIWDLGFGIGRVDSHSINLMA